MNIKFAEMTLNYTEIVARPDMLAVTKGLAAKMAINPYTTVKDFLLSLSTGDLEHLLKISENTEDTKDSHFSELVLITEMLSKAEGLDTQNIEELTVRVNSFLTFLAIEGLARKGLVEVYRENMSFGKDMAEALIVRKLQ